MFAYARAEGVEPRLDTTEVQVRRPAGVRHTCQRVFPHEAAEAGETAVLLRGAAAQPEVSDLAPLR